MFYLTQFLKSISRSKLTGVLFLICTCTLITSSFNQEKINTIVSSSEYEDSNPYFNALISKDVNLNSISRKIKSLPGVKRVKHIKTVDAKEELGKLNKELKSSVLDRLKSVKYSTLTVELTKNLKIKSQNLIKEYLARLVGHESLTISKIKYPRQNQQTDSIVDKVLKNVDYIIIGSLSFLWILLLLGIVKQNASYFYLMEKFQRKVFIKEKSIVIGIGLLVAISTLGNFYFTDDISTYAMSIVLTVMAISTALLLKIKHKGPIN